MSEFEKKKRRLFRIIQIGNKTDLPSTVFDIIISFLIVISITATFLQTFDELAFLKPVLSGIEFVTIVVFTIEYLLRLWTAPYLYENESPGKAVLLFVFSFYGIVDFLTIVPVFFLSGFVIFRMLRVARIFHLFRLNAKYDSFNVITTVLYEKRNQIISSVFIVLILMLASSLCMYSVEHDAQPTVFRNAFSGIWWSMSTLLTVGYGDIYPTSNIGRAFSMISAIVGIALIALPSGIITSGYMDELRLRREKNNKEGE